MEFVIFCNNAWANSGNGNWLVNDGYIRDSNTWEAAGTYASRQNALDGNTFFSIRDPATGTIYLTGDSSAAGGNAARRPISKVTAATSRVPR